MRVGRVLCFACSVAVAAWSLAPGASAQGPSRLPMPLEPFGDSNEAVFPSFEGWGDAPDGTGYLIVVGFKNRNRTQTVEIPVGPNNRIEPGGPDYGQPTVFEPGRQTAVFAIKVPKDFGTRKLTWTLVANGQPAVVVFSLHPDYALNLYKEEATGNEPPRLKFAANDPMVSGPQVGFAQTLTASVGQPVPLKLWAADAPPTEKNWENIISARNRPAPKPGPRDQVAVVNGQVIVSGGGGRPAASSAAPADITVTWKKMRGPGLMTVNPKSVALVTNGNRDTIVEANATATFSAPGEYVVRAEPIEVDDGYDGLCCFSFANLKVVVK